MTQFKVGDRVRCVRLQDAPDEFDVILGHVGTVTRAPENGTVLDVTWDHDPDPNLFGRNCGMFPGELELATPSFTLHASWETP